MNKIFNKNNNVSLNIAIIFAVIVAASFFYNPIFHPDHKSLLTSSKNTSYHLSEHPQYNLIVDLQNSFIRNAKLVGPSVVNISNVHETTINNTARRTPFSNKRTWFPSFKSWFKKRLQEKEYISETIGSGLIINESGYIITNYHVIENRDKILIRLSDKRDYFAKIIGTDPLTDIAVLKISSFRSLPYPSFESSRNVKVGQWVMAIGNPFGLQGSVTVGVISGIGRSDLGITTYENYIQTDASINPGYSGGPLIDLDGKIIGINTSTATIGSGIGFAIPIKMALGIGEELIQNGHVKRGWLGVGVQRLTPALAASFKTSDIKDGIIVNNVEDQTPANIGGMMRGDILIQYDGQKIHNPRSFKNMVANTLVGKRVPIKIIRDGQEKILLVTVGKLNS